MERANKNVGCLLLAALLTAGSAPCQDDAGDRRAEIDAEVTKSLVAFGRRCESLKAHDRARRIYRTILEYYDEEQPTARKGLGFKRIKGEWEEVKTLKQLPKDQAKPRVQRSLARVWDKTSAKVTALHRDYGLALLEDGHVARGRYQLERVLAFVPSDVEAHKGLGHEEYDGFWGTDEQVAFVKRMRAINDKVDEVRALDIDVQKLGQEQMPNALRKTGLPFQGARSKEFECWAVDSQEQAVLYVTWAERAKRMLEFLTEDAVWGDQLLRKNYNKYVAVIRTNKQRDLLLDRAPETRAGETLDRAKLVGGKQFKDGGNNAAWQKQREIIDADRAIGHVTKRYLGWGMNRGLSEGLVHAMTWWLQDTLHSSFMALAHTVTNGKDDSWERDPELWRTKLEEQIEFGQDWPLTMVPRERMDNFRDPCRVKAWSFMRWLLARYPEKWLQFGNVLAAKDLDEAKMGEAYDKILGSTVGDVEEEWRQWAARDSWIGEATRRK